MQLALRRITLFLRPLVPSTFSGAIDQRGEVPSRGDAYGPPTEHPKLSAALVGHRSPRPYLRSTEMRS